LKEICSSGCLHRHLPSRWLFADEEQEPFEYGGSRLRYHLELELELVLVLDFFSSRIMTFFSTFDSCHFVRWKLTKCLWHSVSRIWLFGDVSAGAVSQLLVHAVPPKLAVS
jgi:hypothetical protein